MRFAFPVNIYVSSLSRCMTLLVNSKGDFCLKTQSFQSQSEFYGILVIKLLVCCFIPRD